ncbi:MAG TPA: iron-containing alcohol dehydrogenase [Candidatus Methylomirabilis sp.]|nr:iron-containing alcohol dehydrogenase [Candidatus Methylomirabilis sp.]
MAGNVAIFRVPAQITFGPGAAESVGTEAKRLGGTRAMVVSDPNLQKLGITDRILDSLAAQGVGGTVFTELEFEPSAGSVAPAAAAARDAHSDLVVGLGGGTTLDTAKAVAMLLRNDGLVEDYLGIGLVKQRGVPSILMPTTAGTGAEITPNALFLVPAVREKKAVVSPHIIPDIAMVDPLLTHTVAPTVTAATGMDALSHAVEAYTSLNASPLTDLYALEAIRLIGAHLRTAVANGKDEAAREGMARASMYAGIAIGNAGTNIVHALAYPLQGQHRVTHGIANSLLLPYGMEFNALSNLPKFAAVAEALGEPIAGLSPRTAAARSAEACRLLSMDVGIPQRLREVGIKAEHLPELADGAMKVTRLLANNPRQVRPEDARAIFEKAL